MSQHPSTGDTDRGQPPTGPAHGQHGPHGDVLPIAVRAHTERVRPPRSTAAGRRRPRPRPSAIVDECVDFLVLDTETRTDFTQALTFGAWRHYRKTKDEFICVEEGLFYGDDLPETDPDGMALLRTYAASHRAQVKGRASRRLKLLSRNQFIERIFFPLAYEAHARVVGFNLPFDLSRLAIGVADGRGRNRGGFSFILSPGNANKGYSERRHRPRLTITHVNAFRSRLPSAFPLMLPPPTGSGTSSTCAPSPTPSPESGTGSTPPAGPGASTGRTTLRSTARSPRPTSTTAVRMSALPPSST